VIGMVDGWWVPQELAGWKDVVPEHRQPFATRQSMGQPAGKIVPRLEPGTYARYRLLGRELEAIRHVFRLYRKAGILPGVPAADEGARLAPTCLSELLRHTGAGCFLRSGTIGHKPCIAG
jgi:hypothetical protein